MMGGWLKQKTQWEWKKNWPILSQLNRCYNKSWCLCQNGRRKCNLRDFFLTQREYAKLTVRHLPGPFSVTNGINTASITQTSLMELFGKLVNNSQQLTNFVWMSHCSSFGQKPNINVGWGIFKKKKIGVWNPKSGKQHSTHNKEG